VNQLLKSVVRKNCTLRSVGAGAGDRPGHPVVVSNHDPYSDLKPPWARGCDLCPRRNRLAQSPRKMWRISGSGLPRSVSECNRLHPLRKPSRRSSPLNHRNHPLSSIASGFLRPILGPHADRTCYRHQKKQHGAIKKTHIRKRDSSDSTADRINRLRAWEDTTAHESERNSKTN